MGTPPALVILRGNSASGKSTTAQRVQRSFPRGRVALIGQDHVRRELLWERDSGDGDVCELLEVMVRHCLAAGRITILEGILRAERYGDLCARLLAAHDGPAHVYYLDIPLGETLRRHATKELSLQVGEDDVTSWYLPHDALGVAGEVVLDEHLCADDLVARLLVDLRADPGVGGA